MVSWAREVVEASSERVDAHLVLPSIVHMLLHRSASQHREAEFGMDLEKPFWRSLA